MDADDDRRSAELAAIYDAIYAGRDDTGFWLAMAAATSGGPILELGCGTGRVLLPLARAGYDITGLDLSLQMLDRCRAKVDAEPPDVRSRVRLVEADMTSLDLGRRFAAIICPFAGFQQLRTVEQQLACLDRCRAHLLPQGRLVLDLPNPDPTPPTYARDEPMDGEETAQVVAWIPGRRIRWWMTVIAYDRSLQVNECEVTYEIIEADGATRRLTETISLRYTFRYELEHLLVRAGFRVVALHGAYDCSSFEGESPALIVVAEPDGAQLLRAGKAAE